MTSTGSYVLVFEFEFGLKINRHRAGIVWAGAPEYGQKLNDWTGVERTEEETGRKILRQVMVYDTYVYVSRIW